MAQFLGDIAFALWTALFSAGLITWHFGSREAAGLVKTAAAIMVGVGIAGAACTGYFWFKYESQNAFESAYPMAAHMGAMKGMGMGGMMNEQMPMGAMHHGGMQSHDMQQGNAPIEDATTGHEGSTESDVGDWEKHHNEHSESY